MRTSTATLDEIKKNTWDINLDASVNKSTSCWWALEGIFPNGQTAPELPVTVLPSLTLAAAGAEHSESEYQNRQTCFGHFYISSEKKKVLLYNPIKYVWQWARRIWKGE